MANTSGVYIAESILLHNHKLFDEVKENLLEGYLADLAPQMNRLPDKFLSDFKRWYLLLIEIAPWMRGEKVEELFRIKAEILRRFTYHSIWREILLHLPPVQELELLL